MNRHCSENLPLSLFSKEGFNSSLCKREVRRDFIKQWSHCYEIVFLALILLVLNAVPVNAACEKAQEYYSKAVAPGVSLEDRTTFLEQASGACDSFAVWYELGRAYAEKGELKESVAALKKAVRYAEKDNEKAAAFHLMARVYAGKGLTEDAVRSYRSSLRLAANSAVEKELMKLEKTAAGSIVTSDKILSTLHKGMAERSLGVVASVDLRVNFEFDSAVISKKGRLQADELGRALSASEFSGNKFRIIGHTDASGKDAYNDKLSLRRARSVRDYLVKGFGIDSDRIVVEGKGKRELLYQENSEDAHALNRRVEVVVEEAQ